jgi:hypothetical protein
MFQPLTLALVCFSLYCLEGKLDASQLDAPTSRVPTPPACESVIDGAIVVMVVMEG